MLFEDSFRAMDTQVDILVVAEEPPLDGFLAVRQLFADEEARFSRFDTATPLSQLNRGETVVDPEFAQVCRLALDAFRFTTGHFNPMILPALVDAGYNRSFGDGLAGTPRRQEVPSPVHCLRVDGDRVCLRSGQLDLGGIVKGWTVDRAIEILSCRYPDVCINAGGDVRAEGSEPGHNGWWMTIDGLTPTRSAWEGDLRGALATSSTRNRRWQGAAGTEVHHLIDPRTGVPAVSTFAQVSVWADCTWRAEVWAKAVLIGGSETADDCKALGFRVLALPAGGP